MEKALRRPLWTIQPLAIWEQLCRAGQVFVDPARVNPERWIHPQYSWLVWQLRTRISNSRGALPWWAYCERPDLRWVRHSRPSGSREVRIEFLPPPGAFVTFPCWAWHVVFLGDYLALNRMEEHTWRQRLRVARIAEESVPFPEPFQGELESSWRRLFHPDLPERSWRRTPFGKRREAVVEVLERSWV